MKVIEAIYRIPKAYELNGIAMHVNLAGLNATTKNAFMLMFEDTDINVMHANNVNDGDYTLLLSSSRYNNAFWYSCVRFGDSNNINIAELGILNPMATIEQISADCIWYNKQECMLHIDITRYTITS